MSCARLDRDQTIIVHDFGPRGFIGPVSVNLTQGFQPGGSLTIVVSTDHEWLLNIFDGNKNNIFHLAARPYKNDLATNSHINGTWGAEERPEKNPIQRGVRAAVTIVYEATGYRLFVNGKEELFYKHRTTNIPTTAELHSGQFYKVVYMNQMELIPQ